MNYTVEDYTFVSIAVIQAQSDMQAWEICNKQFSHYYNVRPIRIK